MGCDACKNPEAGGVNRACRACQVRFIAGGPFFFASVCAGRLLPKYIDEIKATFGNNCDVENIHADIKAAAKKLNIGVSAYGKR